MPEPDPEQIIPDPNYIVLVLIFQLVVVVVVPFLWVEGSDMFPDGGVLLKDLAAVGAGEGGVHLVDVHMLLHTEQYMYVGQLATTNSAH